MGDPFSHLMARGGVATTQLYRPPARVHATVRRDQDFGLLAVEHELPRGWWSIMVRMLLGVAASDEFLDLDDSWSPLSAALSDEGIAAEVAGWDDPRVDWSRYDLVTVMYAWGYVSRREAFLAWAETVEAAVTVVNDAATLRWNSQKTYLVDLAGAGIPVVPTV